MLGQGHGEHAGARCTAARRSPLDLLWLGVATGDVDSMLKEVVVCGMSVCDCFSITCSARDELTLLSTLSPARQWCRCRHNITDPSDACAFGRAS